MKKITSIITLFMLIITISGCTLVNPDVLRESVVDHVDFFIGYNELVHSIHDPSIPNIPIKDVMLPSDFEYYDSKSPENVELEYSDFYDSFSSLLYLKEVISNITDFSYGEYFDDVVQKDKIRVDFEDDELSIDYYEYILEVDVSVRQTYILKQTSSNEGVITKYTTVYGHDKERIIKHSLEIMTLGETVEKYELLPDVNTVVYIYNSHKNQEYFKYRGTLLSNGEFERQTVELYLDEHNAFVSFDFKEDDFEDYRVKFFEEGHRVLKVDVNVFKNSEQMNELTWNLLSVDGWDFVQYVNEDFLISKTNATILEDYNIEIQNRGYGKVIAYKEFTGELLDSELTLSDYGLDSRITLVDVENAITTYKKTLMKPN